MSKKTSTETMLKGLDEGKFQFKKKKPPSAKQREHLKKAREIFEKKYLEYNLNKFNNNISVMSDEIGMERTALYRKLKSLNISVN